MSEISTTADIDGGSQSAPTGIDASESVAEPAFIVEPSIMARVSYALAHNRVPTVPRIRIRNLSSNAGSPLTISVSSKWAAARTSPMASQEFVIDCPERGDWVELDTTSLRLDDTAIVDLDEAAPASIIVTVSDAAGQRATCSEDIVVLARNQWNQDVPDITAAFVQPNHPAAVDILKDASRILLARTGDGSLQGYQSGPQRAVEIARAIFEALKAQVPTYINPPASFDSEGQKLRPLDQVLDEGQGTCIDLACAYASCLEQAGVNPVVALVHGHAFTLFFTRDQADGGRLPETVVSDYTTILNFTDRDLLVPVETTGITGDTRFEDAVVLARSNLNDRDLQCGYCQHLIASGVQPHLYPHLEHAVDIMQAHQRGVRPLPARVIRNGIVTIVIDNGPGEPAITERRDAKTNKVMPQTIPARVQQWKNSLLDLSLRPGGLLNFDATKQGVLLLPPKGKLGAIEDFLVDGGKIEVLSDGRLDPIQAAAGYRNVRDLADEMLLGDWQRSHSLYGMVASPMTIDKRIKLLMSRAKLEFQETGVNNLMLTLGSVITKGTGPGGSDRKAPVFLVPITVGWNRGRTAPVVTVDSTAMTTVNYSLLETLRARPTPIALEWFRNDMRDASGLDVAGGLEHLREEILAAGASVELDVVDDAAIGLLRFSKIRLWKDLDDHWESFMTSPVVRHLVEGGNGNFTDHADPDRAGAPSFNDTTLLNPQPADGAQTKAVVRALAGQSFVLEGPPGTGKSQTITNLLANALAGGKKVLFVAQKEAARDVVKERLAAVGLDPFVLDLHDKGSTTDQIKKQLAEALDFRPAAAMERWEKLQSAFDVTARALDTYRNRLHGPTSAGRSYSSAYESLLELGEGPVALIGRQLAHLPSDEIAAIRAVLLELNEFTSATSPDRHHPWRFAALSSIDSVDRAALASAIGQVAAAMPVIASAEGIWGTVVRSAAGSQGIRAASAALSLIDAGRLPTPAQWREIARPDWLPSVSASLESAGASIRSLHGLDPHLPVSLLTNEFSARVLEVQAAEKSFILGRKARVRAALGEVSTYLVFTEGRPASAAVASLETLASAYRAAVRALSAAEGLGLTADIVVDASMIEVLDRRSRDLAAVAAVVTSDTAGGEAMLTALNGIALPSPALRSQVDAIVDGIDRVLILAGANDEGVEAWLSGRDIITAVNAALPAWTAAADANSFVTLRRWAALLLHLEPLAQPLFRDARLQILNGDISGEDAPEAFDRALMNATLLVVGEDHQFDVFDWMGHDRQISRFIGLLEERQRMLETVIPQILHDGRSFDASATIGVVGQFRQELNAKRRGARSVRDILSKYPELILQLTPCFLMSPDSVAKFLEAGKVRFDLVVFDEASQIQVADAIGAMGRADSVVIVGDSRQMPPTTAFVTTVAGRAGADEFEDGLDAVPEDADSILEECVESGLPREMLSWHYRSRDELLIHFSNSHYYEGRLASFPAPISVRPDCGIEYHRVNGQFDHGASATNPIEADAIVAEVLRRVHHPELSQHSMGVVTLNQKQMELVLEKLRALQDEAIIDLLDNSDPDRELFVLNLESVQGRERDVIILGTSFSKRANGDDMPLIFGPLNRARGERRLNVAITRARRQVIIFTSFDPEELLRATAVGLIHLREYLELARKASTDRAGLQMAATPSTINLHTREIAEALRARGLVVHEGFGLSSFKVDLAVTTAEHPDEWLVGVLLDGHDWGQRELALDRDALPVTVLRNLMNWPAIARIWLPAWRRDSVEIISHVHEMVTVAAAGLPQQSQANDIAEELGTAGSAPASPAAQPEGFLSVPADQPESSPPRAEFSRTAPPEFVAQVPAGINADDAWFARRRRIGTGPRFEYTTWEADRTYGVPTQLDVPNHTVTILLETVADAEGPIEVGIALRKVARAFGLERVREARLPAIAQNLPRQRIVRTEFGDYLFPLDSVDGQGGVHPSFTWYRQTTFTERKIDVIAPHEVANVMVERVTAAHGITEEELASELLVFFGYGRRTVETLAYARKLIGWALQRGYLASDGGLIRVRDGS